MSRDQSISLRTECLQYQIFHGLNPVLATWNAIHAVEAVLQNIEVSWITESAIGTLEGLPPGHEYACTPSPDGSLSRTGRLVPALDMNETNPVSFIGMRSFKTCEKTIKGSGAVEG